MKKAYDYFCLFLFIVYILPLSVYTFNLFHFVSVYNILAYITSLCFLVLICFIVCQFCALLCGAFSEKKKKDMRIFTDCTWLVVDQVSPAAGVLILIDIPEA